MSSWDLTSMELDEDTDWSFVDTLPEGRWSYAFQNIACSAQSGTPVISGTEHDELHWTPGNNGKGIVEADDTVHTWNAVGPLQEPWHFEYMRDHGIQHTNALFYIDPDGGVYNLNTGADETEDARIRELLRQTDPNLNVGEGGWTFSRTATHHDGDVLDWDEGQIGKGIVDVHGNVYTWDAEDWNLHRDYEEAHDITGKFWFTIDEDGRVDSADMTPLDPGALDVITEADPRLHGEPTVAWTF